MFFALFCGLFRRNFWRRCRSFEVGQGTAHDRGAAIHGEHLAGYFAGQRAQQERDGIRNGELVRRGIPWNGAGLEPDPADPFEVDSGWGTFSVLPRVDTNLELEFVGRAPSEGQSAGCLF